MVRSCARVARFCRCSHRHHINSHFINKFICVLKHVNNRVKCVCGCVRVRQRGWCLCGLSAGSKMLRSNSSELELKGMKCEYKAENEFGPSPKGIECQTVRDKHMPHPIEAADFGGGRGTGM